jgi:hypothetical protein
MLRPIAVIALACLLSSCISPTDRKIQKLPDYRLGYDDGCATATNQGANMRRGDMVRDDSLYDSDKAYRSGWASGHSACARMAPTGQANGPLADPQLGGGH